MRVYLADAGTRFQSTHTESLKRGFSQGEIFNGAHVLWSYFYINPFAEKIVIPNCKSFLLDSGAFTFLSSSKKSADWDSYLAKYAEFISNNGVDLFFELDIDPVVGYENVKKYRAKLERLTGKQAIPVWHKSRGKDEFLALCRDYPYVAVGGIVTKEIKREQHKYFPWFIDTAHENDCMIHGLGYTSPDGLHKYHFDSVDSSSWTSGNRFGISYTFNGQTLVQRKKPQNTRLQDHYGMSFCNFNEWLKFQRYAETHL